MTKKGEKNGICRCSLGKKKKHEKMYPIKDNSPVWKLIHWMDSRTKQTTKFERLEEDHKGFSSVICFLLCRVHLFLWTCETPSVTTQIGFQLKKAASTLRQPKCPEVF